MVRANAKSCPQRIKGEAHYSMLHGTPRLDLETDTQWRHLRLGTSQGYVSVAGIQAARSV